MKRNKILALAVSVLIGTQIVSMNTVGAQDIAAENDEISACSVDEEVVASGQAGVNCTWTVWKAVEDGQMRLEISGKGKMESYQSSSKVPWTEYRDKITEVYIPYGITQIGNMSFMGMRKLEEIEIPGSVQLIGSSAFTACSALKRVIIKNDTGILEIGNGAFEYDGALEEIVLPDGIRRIDHYAFESCRNLKTLTIGNGCTYIGARVFDECPSLTLKVNQGSAAETYAVNNQIPYEIVGVETKLEDQNVKSGKCGENVTWELQAIPETNRYELILSGYGEMTDYVASTYIPWKSYSIEKVTISDDITRIGDYAFSDCYFLENVQLPGQLTSMGTGCFKYSGLMDISIPGSVKEVEKEAFEFTPLRKLTVNEGTTIIKEYAFYGCSNIEEIVLPDSLCEIRTGAFQEVRSLKNITLSPNVKLIEEMALGYITVGNQTGVNENFTITGYSNTFAESYANANGITFISLGEAEIVPESGKCGENLTYHLDMDGTLTIEGTGEMYEYTQNTSVQVPWYNQKKAIKKLVVADGVTSIGSFAFYKTDHLQEIQFSDTVESINAFAFMDCKELTGLVVPKYLASLGQGAFTNCEKLPSVIELPGSIAYFGGASFENCPLIEKIYIGKNPPEYDGCIISENPIGYCVNLKEIKVVEGHAALQSIDGVLYMGYGGAKTLMQYPAGKTDKIFRVNDACTTIFKASFDGVRDLETLIIPESVQAVTGDLLNRYHHEMDTALKNIVITNDFEIDEKNLGPFYGMDHVTLFYPAVFSESDLEYLLRGVGEEFVLTPYDEHLYLEENVLSEADCTEAGVTEKICVLCEESAPVITEPLGHEYADGICVRCGCEKAPILTIINATDGSLRVQIENAEMVLTKGMILADEDYDGILTLETQGNTCVFYEELDAESCFTFVPSENKQMVYRAFATYLDQDGKEQIAYSSNEK